MSCQKKKKKRCNTVMDGNPRIWGLLEIREKEEDDSRVPSRERQGCVRNETNKNGAEIVFVKKAKSQVSFGAWIK